MTLYDKYGHCIIPKGTKLFKGGNPDNHDDCIFLGLQKYVATAFKNNSNKVQIWTVKQDIKLLFMVEELNHSSWTKSAIVNIYNEHFPSENRLNDLDIKHRDLNKRDKFINKLKKQNIIGWLSSLEGRVDLEICLFPDNQEFDKVIALETVIDHDNKEFDYINALDRIDIYPSKQFFTQTAAQLNERPFATYAKMAAAWKEDEMKKGLTDEQARQYHLNLRTKLTI
mgnify:FL=1